MQTGESSGAKLLLTNLVLQLMSTSAIILYIFALVSLYRILLLILPLMVLFQKEHISIFLSQNLSRIQILIIIITITTARFFFSFLFLNSKLQAFTEVFKHFQVMLEKAWFRIQMKNKKTAGGLHLIYDIRNVIYIMMR